MNLQHFMHVLKIFMHKKSSSDFVVWSKTGNFLCEHILPNTDFISEQLNLTEIFFYFAILSKLLSKWFTRDYTALPTVMLHDDSDEEEDNGSCSNCQEAKGGDMIGCENVSCSMKWFHKE